MMSASTLKSIAAGGIFGAAITAAGVYSPAVIIGQMKFENFQMMKAFIAASASSAIAILIAKRWSLTTTKPRMPNTLNWFGTYDGNIIGGLMLGSGMALTGACPGTVLPQVATGVRSGPIVLLGCVLGGILYSRFGKSLQAKVCDQNAIEKPTVYQKYGAKETNALLVYEGLCAAILGAVSYFAPGDGKVLIPGMVGGGLIGVSQGASLLLTGNSLGVSTAYEQVGDLFWWGLDSIKNLGPTTAIPNVKGTAFVAGTVIGSWALGLVVKIPRSVDVEIGAVRAVLGGAIMLFGSRIAGGCTSGHGISGMSQLSISSIIAVLAMFAGGMGLTALLR